MNVDRRDDGSPRMATYRLNKPGGMWNYLDNGLYTILVQQSEVEDVAGNAIAAMDLGNALLDFPIPAPIVLSHPADQAVVSLETQ